VFLVFLGATAGAMFSRAVGADVALRLAFTCDVVGVALTFSTSDGFPFVFLGLELPVVECESVVQDLVGSLDIRNRGHDVCELLVFSSLLG